MSDWNIIHAFMLLLKNQFKKNRVNVHGAPSSGHHGHGGGVQWTCLQACCRDFLCQSTYF